MGINEYLQKAKTYCDNKEYKKAEKILEKAIRLDPKNVDAYGSLGFIYHEQKEYEKAEETFKKIIELDPKYTKVYNNLAILYYDQQKYQKVAKTLKELIGKEQDNIAAYNLLCNVYIQQKEYKKAEEILTDIISKNLYNNVTYNLLSHVYIEKEEYEKAEKALEKAIRIGPGYSETYNNLGFIYNKLGKYEQAKEAIKKIIELDPKNVDAYGSLGFIYHEQKEYEKAEETFKKIIELDPKYTKVYNNLAILYYDQQKYQKVAKTLKELIGKEQDNIAAYNLLCNVYIQQKEYKKAEEILTELYKKDPVALFNSEFGLIAEIISKLDNNCYKEIKNYLILLAVHCLEMKKLCKYISTDGVVSHYTKTHNLKLILKKDKINIRMSNYTEMNDPNEGTMLKFLDELLYKENTTNVIAKPSNVFLASFSTIEDKSVPMWVHYGHGAKGCNIQFKSSIFDKQDIFKSQVLKNENNNIDLETYCLYKVIYIDNTNKNESKKDCNIKFIGIEDDKSKELNKTFKEIEELITEIINHSKDDKVIKDIINICIDNIRFLFKDKSYEYEQELRLIKYIPSNNSNTNDKIKIDDSNNFEIPWVYINMDKDIPLDKVSVVLGSKCEEKTKIANYLYTIGVNEVKESSTKYK